MDWQQSIDCDGQARVNRNAPRHRTPANRVFLNTVATLRTAAFVAAATVCIVAPRATSSPSGGPTSETHAAGENEQPKSVRVGAASVEIAADDSMIIGGGIGPGRIAGHEGKLLATAFVISADTKLCLVACDVLMVNRDLLDAAARRISTDCHIPFEQILINASHTHHAPTTVTVHDYSRDDGFCRNLVESIVAAAQTANRQCEQASPVEPVFRLSQEATVGQNSRQLLKDGKVYWIGPRDGFVRPTGPFDADLPVWGFRRPDGTLAAAFFNHSTHCIGTRSGKRSPGFYGLAAQELTDELHAPVAFFSGAAGSTHNLTLTGDEMVARIKTAVHEGIAGAEPMSSTRLAGLRREFTYRVRMFDDAAEDRAVNDYCRLYAPQNADTIIRVFRESRAKLRTHQGELRTTWLQALRIGDVYVVGVPAEFFTKLGLEIKRRSPHRYTFVFGLSNDYMGYVPDRDAFELGGYQTWTGLHSFAAPGIGEAIVDEAIALLRSL